MRVRVTAPLLLAAAAVACAQPGSPPGGEVDRSPPRVLAVAPAAFDTLTRRDERIVIRFDERISERLQGVRNWEEAVLVSPATSPIRVKAGRRHLEISLVRGWEPDRVYRVVVRPVFRDLFGNPRAEPIDLVFSTGAPFPDAAVAGFVSDRLTARPLPDARVEATRGAGEAAFVALSDTTGFFAMPYLPGGTYALRAWVDQNRDRAPDFFEIQDSVAVAFGGGDTTIVELRLLRPDTTPARLARAEPIDSLKVRLVFDDYFAVGPVEGEARLHSLPDSALIGRARLVHGSRLDSIRAVEAEATALQKELDAVLDSVSAADEQPDRPPVQVARERLDRRQADRRAPAGKAPLPSQELILLSPIRLQPDSAYYVVARGVVNIQGVEGGGGRAVFVMPPPAPPADTVPGAALPADTLPPTRPDTVPNAPIRQGTGPPGSVWREALPPPPGGSS